MFKNGEFYLGSCSKQWNNLILKVLEMSPEMLKQRYFYPTNLFIAKYDTILRDFSCVCQIKCLKCKLLHFIFKLLEERRKFKLECAFFFLVLHTVYVCVGTLTDERQCANGTLGKALEFWVLLTVVSVFPPANSRWEIFLKNILSFSGCIKLPSCRDVQGIKELNAFKL